MEAAQRSKTMQGNTSMAAVVAHPLRARLWTILTERAASSKELARELGETLPNVAYHMRLLSDAGVVELVDSQPRRGATEKWYRAVRRPMILREDPDDRTLEERTSFAQFICQHSFADATVALDAGTFAAREDHVIARVPLNVDEEGWKELVDLYDETLERTLQIQAASAERDAGRPEPAPGVKVTALLGTFEMP